MPTLNENIHQAIEDFDGIKSAIIEKGVEVPAGTSTSEYGEKIKEIETGITPTGTLDITENGLRNVATYEFANVGVEQGIFPSGTNYVYANGNYDIKNYEYCQVQVSQKATEMCAAQNYYHFDTDVVPVSSFRPYCFYNSDHLRSVNLSYSDDFSYIGAYCFAFSQGFTSNLDSIIFPSVLSSTGYMIVAEHAFENCINLREIDMSIVTELGAYCFNGCGVRKLYFSNLRTVGQNTFSNTNSLTDIYYTGTQAEWESVENMNISGIDSSVTIHYNYTSE